MFFHLVVENPRSQILAMLLTEKACYPQKSKPTARPVHMWSYVTPWVIRTWCFHSIGDSWLLLTRQWTGMDASGTEVKWIGVKAGQGPRYRNPSSIRHSESLSLLSSPQPLLILWFSDTWNFFVTKTVVYLETKNGVGDREAMAIPEHISKSSAFSDHHGGKKV